jgi:hypothetical protein
VLFGNGETDEFDISRLIYGLNSYQRLKSSLEIQRAFGIEAYHLSGNAVPPGMQKVIVTGQLGGKVVKSKTVASAIASVSNGRKPGRPSSVALSSSSSSATVTLPAAANSLSDDDQTDSIVCLICGDSCNNMKILRCDLCNRQCHLSCTTSSLFRTHEGNSFCQECSDSIATSNINGEIIGENEDCKQRIGNSSSFNAKIDYHTCDSCSKQFNSLVGYQYHVEHICLRDEESINEKQLDKSQIIRKAEQVKIRSVVSNGGNVLSKHSSNRRCDEMNNGRSEKAGTNYLELDHLHLPPSSSQYENTDKYMSEGARKSILYRNHKMNWLCNPLISLALSSSGRNAVIIRAISWPNL